MHALIFSDLVKPMHLGRNRADVVVIWVKVSYKDEIPVETCSKNQTRSTGIRVILRLSAKLFVLLGLISGCNESSGISVLSYTTMLPYMSIFECASCLEA